MTKKKGKLMTFCWSLIPGAGEMYLGFFKQGLSLMALFAILLGVSGFLQLNFLTFLSPLVWFYSFFHTNNLNSLSDEEFYGLEDDFIIRWPDISPNQETVKKHYKLVACCLIFFGISILWNLFSRLLFWYVMPLLYLPDEVNSMLRYITNTIPQGVVAIAIIVAGIYLIKGKREELDKENPDIPSPPYLEKKETAQTAGNES